MLTGAHRVVFLHAHPDDETLVTGALIVELVARGVEVAVITATRGERGEVVPGPLSHLQAGSPELSRWRERELSGAVAALGVQAHAFLGDPPALRVGEVPRRYRDSGMVWVSEGLAGPAPDAGEDSLSLAPQHQAAADLAAFLQWWRADRLISYDGHGGYGHPDHVACHQIAVLASGLSGVRCLEIVSDARLRQARPDAEYADHVRHLSHVRQALGHHASQLTVTGDRVVHVGGQSEPIRTSVMLQPAG